MPVTLTIPQKIKWDCSLKVVYESEYSMHLQGRLSEVEFQQCLQSLSEASSAHRMSWGELIFYIVGMSALGFLGLGAVGLKVISGDYFAIVFAILSTVLSLLLIVCVIGLIVRTRTIANQRKEAVKKVLESLNQIHNSMGLNWRLRQIQYGEGQINTIELEVADFTVTAAFQPVPLMPGNLQVVYPYSESQPLMWPSKI